MVKMEYPKSSFLELVHRSELFEPIQNCIVKRCIGCFSILLNPRMTWWDQNEKDGMSENALDVWMETSLGKYLLSTWKAVSLCLGSEFNIFLTRSFAPGEIEGHGSLVKSSWPRRIALKIPFSDSVDQRCYISDSKQDLFPIIRLETNLKKVTLLEKKAKPAQKGGTPERRIYSMTPILHMSASGPYLLLKTSGAKVSTLHLSMACLSLL